MDKNAGGGIICSFPGDFFFHDVGSIIAALRWTANVPLAFRRDRRARVPDCLDTLPFSLAPAFPERAATSASLHYCQRDDDASVRRSQHRWQKIRRRGMKWTHARERAWGRGGSVLLFCFRKCCVFTQLKRHKKIYTLVKMYQLFPSHPMYHCVIISS